MKRYSKVYFFCWFLPQLFFHNRIPVVQKIIEIGKSDNQTMHHQDILCNRIGGESPAPDAYRTACNWVMGELKSWGLEVKLDEVGEVPVGL